MASVPQALIEHMVAEHEAGMEERIAGGLELLGEAGDDEEPAWLDRLGGQRHDDLALGLVGGMLHDPQPFEIAEKASHRIAAGDSNSASATRG